MNYVLNSEDNIVLQAKRIILNEHLENVADIILTKIKTDTVLHNEAVINYSPGNHIWFTANRKNHYEIPDGTIFDTSHISNKGVSSTKTARTEKELNELLKKYFNLWKGRVKQSKDDNSLRNRKLENFITNLKSSATITELNSNTNHDIQNKSKKDILARYSGECFRNRFKAQENVIKMQKIKLAVQDKVIQDLKLGIMSEEINESLQSAKDEFRLNLAKSSAVVKHKIAPLSPVDSARLEITSSKMPKIVQEMEKRAIDRAHKRELVLQRKYLKDQEEKRRLEAELERKRALDEEQKKLNLEAIKERRRIQMEIERQNLINKRIHQEKNRMADNFRTQKLKQLGLKGFLKLIAIKAENIEKSEQHFATFFLRKHFMCWAQFVNEVQMRRNIEADRFYHRKLLLKTMQVFRQMHAANMQLLQVAEDLYDMKLESKTFFCWSRYHANQKLLEKRNMKKAERHYNSRILLQYFYQWRSLPAVTKLEQAKEERKRKWRERVLEVLPDYEQPDGL